MPDQPNQGASAPVESAPAEQNLESQVENEEESSEEAEEESKPEGKAEGKEKAVENLSSKEQKQLAKNLKKYNLKVDGKESEEEVDLNDDEGMTKRLQLAKASQKRMQEATELRKAAEEFIDMLKTNPRKVLTDPNIGIDLKKLAMEIINEEAENAAKSPEQQEKEKLQKELEELKSKYEKDEKDRKDREFSRLQAEHEEKIQSDIESALKTNELPKTPYTVRKMAEMMMLALQNDIDLSPKDLVPLLRKQMSSDFKEFIGASSDDILEEIIGKERISGLRKKNVAKVKNQQVAQTANSVKSTGKAEVKADKKDSKKIEMKDFLRGKF